MLERVGRYRIIGELGRGAMGTVYRAADDAMGREVALKTVPRPDATSPPRQHAVYARFLREARAAGRLSHPNVVTAYDAGADAASGLSYIAMELIEGESLDLALQRRQPFDFERIRDIGRQVAAALAAAHANGIVHRDVKPGNLILQHGGAVLVTDFGIAKIAQADMTEDGTLLGSPAYMSPEQVRASAVDHRSDLFSLGSVLFELATLERPFPGDNPFEVMQAVAAGTVVPPRTLRPEIPEDLEAVILRALQRDPEARFQTAAELGRALGAAEKTGAMGGVVARAAPALVADTAQARRTATGTLVDTPAVVDPGTRRSRPAGGGRQPRGRALALAAVLGLATLGAILTFARAGRPPLSAGATDRGTALAPAPTARAIATPPASPAASPTPVAPARATPAALQRERPAAAVHRIAVAHPHVGGSCTGQLAAFADRLEYQTRAGGGHPSSLRWAWDALSRLDLARGELRFQADEPDPAGTGRRAQPYAFTLTGDPLPAAAADYLEERIDRPAPHRRSRPDDL